MAYGAKMKYHLECVKCGSIYESSYDSQICGKCDGILEVVYDEKLPKIRSISKFWDLKPILPDSKYKEFVVGSTPVYKIGSGEVYAKLEMRNPTNSFKDRGSVIEIAKASEYGFKEVVCASTGNMAYSITYYAKLYGIKARIFISQNANADKIKDIKSVGDAEITRVNGDFTKAQAMALSYSKHHTSFLTGDYCYRKEGQKTIMHEIYHQLGQTEAVALPVGNATLLSATYKAMKELKQTSGMERMPAIIAVQASACDPIVKSFHTGKGIRYQKPKTKADAIAVGLPTFGAQGIEAIKSTSGFAVSVTEKEMASEQERFYKDYGIMAELASVAVFAGIAKLKPKGKIAAIITGSNI